MKKNVVPSRIGAIMRGNPSADAIEAYFQPIENLQTGEIVGFEALARLVADDRIIPPVIFLAGMTRQDLEVLFRAMIGRTLALLATLRLTHPHVYVSVNIETTLLLADDFVANLQAILAEHGHDGRNLVLELLEGTAITDFGRMGDTVRKLHGLGLKVALDDIGSAYGSLINLRNLPIDIIKLDQSFARGVGDRPHDLHFVLSVLSLARGLEKTLIVEGVETDDIRDALRVLGVTNAQGFAIARPMPAEAVPAWLLARVSRDPDRTPLTMLGAYAAHLTVVETCRVLMNQPLQIEWRAESKNPHSCAIGKFFDKHDFHDTACGLAHKRFHDVIALFDSDAQRWTRAAEDFRFELETSIAETKKGRFICESVEALR